MDKLSKKGSKIAELIEKGREQGYLTYADVNDHLPEDISDPDQVDDCLLYTSPSPRDLSTSRMPSSA